MTKLTNLCKILWQTSTDNIGIYLLNSDSDDDNDNDVESRRLAFNVVISSTPVSRSQPRHYLFKHVCDVA